MRWSLGSPAALARFEGRRTEEGEGEEGRDAVAEVWPEHARAQGRACSAAAQEWAAEVRSLRSAHRFTQACVAEHAWRQAGLSTATAIVEPAVVAMKIAAKAGRGGAPFAPLARRRRLGCDRPIERLHGFYADIAAGCGEALILLERMQDWRARAAAEIANLSGRTPRLLVALLAARVAVSAQEAASASRRFCLRRPAQPDCVHPARASARDHRAGAVPHVAGGGVNCPRTSPTGRRPRWRASTTLRAGAPAPWRPPRTCRAAPRGGWFRR